MIKLLLILAILGPKFPERRIAREGNELFEKGDLQGAAARYETALKLREEFTEARYNLGNAMLGGEKIDEAIEHYKSVLRAHPDDQDAKYNLAYAQKLKQEQDGGGEQEQQPQEPRQGDGDPQEQEQEQPQPGQGQPQMSQAEGEAMLEAMQAEEDKTKQEMDAEKVPAAPRSGKNW